MGKLTEDDEGSDWRDQDDQNTEEVEITPPLPDPPAEKPEPESKGPYSEPMPEPSTAPDKSIHQLANECEKGLWGPVGQERDDALRAKGFSANLVKGEINRRRYQAKPN